MHGFPIAGRIAGEIGFVNLATVGLPARCVMIGPLTAGQFFVFDIVMDLTGAAKFHFHGVWPSFLPPTPSHYFDFYPPASFCPSSLG